MMNKKTHILTDKAPVPAGHYSQAVEYNGLIFVSGLLPVDPETGAIETDSVERSVGLIFRNLNSILDAASGNLDTVIKTTVYIRDMKLWSGIDKYYAIHFNNNKPARTVVEASGLHHGVILEMDAIAHRI